MSGSTNFGTLKGNHPAVHSQQGLTQRETLPQASIVQKHKQTIKLILGLMYMAKKHYIYTQKPLLGVPQVLTSNPAKSRTHTLLGASGPVQENEMPGNPGLYFLILVAGPGAL